MAEVRRTPRAETDLAEILEYLHQHNPSEVEVQVKLVQPTKPTTVPMSEGLARVYEILGRRHSSGHTDTAERHNEHQP